MYTLGWGLLGSGFCWGASDRFIGVSWVGAYGDAGVGWAERGRLERVAKGRLNRSHEPLGGADVGFFGEAIEGLFEEGDWESG